jgi:hypothetical protein
MRSKGDFRGNFPAQFRCQSRSLTGLDNMSCVHLTLLGPAVFLFFFKIILVKRKEEIKKEKQKGE